MKWYIKLLVFTCGLAQVAAQPTSAASPTNSALCIEYFGESTAPVIPIVVSDSSTGAERGRKEVLAKLQLHVDIVRVSIVDPQLMADLLAEFANLPIQGQSLPSDEGSRRPYMIFHIVALTPSGDSVRTLDGHLTGAFLRSLESHCREGALLDNLEKLRSWIEE